MNAASIPSPTATTAARGILSEVVAPTATKPGYLVFAVPGSQYKLHLRGTTSAAVGGRLIGHITLQSRRVDVTHHGGRFVEPVVGRPRRVQGTVLAVDAQKNTITVNAGGAVAVDSGSLPITATLTDPRQRAEKFEVGQLVGFDALDGATFTQA